MRCSDNTKDTPRTDEAEANAIASGIPISMICRQLERELNDAIAERDELITYLQWLHNLYEHIGFKRYRSCWLDDKDMAEFRRHARLDKAGNKPVQNVQEN